MMTAVAVVAKDGLYRDGYLVSGLNRLGFDAEGFASDAPFYRRLLMKPFDTLVLSLESQRDLETARYLRGVMPIKVVVLAETPWSAPASALAEVADAWLDLHVRVETLATMLQCLARGKAIQGAGSIGWRLSDGAKNLVSPDGRTLPLNSMERLILACLMARPNKVVTYTEIIEALARERLEVDQKRLRLLINRLQQKMVVRFGTTLPLRLIRGHGYQMRVRRVRTHGRGGIGSSSHSLGN